MSGPYAYAAPEYWNAGWRGVLPLPPERKANPPGGERLPDGTKAPSYTGWDGILPSWPDVMAWTEDRPNGNIALRLQRGIVGLDIDAYIKAGVQKRGAETLASAERMWGPLPPTWRSTSRDDGISGIRLYRVADGLRWPGTFGPGTETIHFGHRYVVAPPSIHDETGKPYRWITPDGAESQTPPRVDELPWLPATWVVGITENRSERALQGAGMNDDAAAQWLEAHNRGDHPCGPMREVSDHIAELMADGAHESLSHLMRLVSLAGRGHEGLYPALNRARAQFLTIAGRRRDGGEREAAEEWRRSLFGAVDKIVGSEELPDSPLDPCEYGVLDVEPSPAVDSAVDELPSDDDDTFTGSWQQVFDEVYQAKHDEFVAMDMEDDHASDEPPAETPEQRYEREVLLELGRQRKIEEARRRLAAEGAPALQLLSFGDFLASPEPEPVVDRMLYVDSLARIYGKPGCGKSFLALDLAFHVALGMDWDGQPVRQGPVVYVMAEGQRVNTHRAKAWLERHHVEPAELEGKFWAVPDKVLLTEAAAAPFVNAVTELAPTLIILDTQNAMQVGEENSGSDTRIMRDALDAMRHATQACVVLIGHTGKTNQDSARGSGAAEAAMDTEVKVENDGGSPAHVTVTVSRDKAAEDGVAWEFFLRMQPIPDHDKPGAVLVPMGEDVELPRRHVEDEDAWQEGGGAAVPVELLHYEGEGGKALPDLARWMSYEASPRGADPNGVGRSMADAVRAFKGQHGRNTVTRAWSILRQRKDIEPAEGIKAHTGRHVWTR